MLHSDQPTWVEEKVAYWDIESYLTDNLTRHVGKGLDTDIPKEQTLVVKWFQARASS